MRMMMKVSIPVEAGNTAALKGTLVATIQQILADLRPEAAYYSTDNGTREVLVVLDVRDSSQLPGVTEPWFLAFSAHVSMRPALTLQDLSDGSHYLQMAVKTYGRASPSA
jgi:hypothetical protein